MAAAAPDPRDRSGRSEEVTALRISVVICTWNRASLLEQTLEQMTHLRVPVGAEWELLVVDNNSTDGTDDVVGRFRSRLPLRALFEPDPGKSHALNRAVREATGSYIVFTDDDVLVDPHWIDAYARAFRRWPEAAIFGGPILPWFEGTPPEWLTRTFGQVAFAFAALDLGDAPRPFGGDKVPFGANMAIRATEQRRYPYDPALGPRPGSGLRGEEVTLVKAMMRDGAEGWWVPDARVRHFVPIGRQTVPYIREWYHGWGVYLARTAKSAAGGGLLGRPLWLWREVIESEVRFRLRRRAAEPEEWIEDLKKASIAKGRFDGLGARAPQATRTAAGGDA